MQIQAYIPKGPLKEFIDVIHFISGKEMGTGIAFPRMQQVIIINMGSPFSTSEIYSTSRPSTETDSTIWMNGKQDHPFLLGNTGITSMYAIGLKLGMLPYFADLPAIETNNLALGAEHWTSRGIFELRERLLYCRDSTEGFLVIEQYLLQQLQKRTFPDLDRVKWMGRMMYTHTVEEICRQSGMTRKQLRKVAQQHFGDAVKNIQGIIRLNKTLKMIAETATASPTVPTLSAIHPYFDQSHFIHDFKARTGITPLQYRRLCQHFPFIRHTPNFIALPQETFLQFISNADR